MSVVRFRLWAASTPITIKYKIEREENSNSKFNLLVLPYFFSTETMGLNFGVGGVMQGLFQEQLVMGATAYKGADTYGISGGFFNYLIPKTKNLYLSSVWILWLFFRIYSLCWSRVWACG